MFVRTAPRPPGTRAGRPPLPSTLATRVRPISPAGDRLLPVDPLLSPLFPDGALRRGSTVLVTGDPGHGATTLAFSLLVAASTAGSWCAAVGFGDPGVVALAELGVDLERLALVPDPGSGWADTAAALVDGLEVVLVRPPARAAMTAARHLVARTRDRQAVLVVLARRAEGWPEPADVHLQLGETSWWGMERGHVPLRARRAEVRSSGRRAAWRPLRRDYWLPGDDGRLSAAGDPSA
ncbi:MAG TPA: hypothetical protein VMB82_05275 [Acidimicrobiales bacterium]|nr:hypothetical protein [Acidimicrobiales bacterium]